MVRLISTSRYDGMPSRTLGQVYEPGARGGSHVGKPLLGPMILDALRAAGKPLSIHELADAVGRCDLHAVRGRLGALVRKGLVRKAATPAAGVALSDGWPNSFPRRRSPGYALASLDPVVSTGPVGPDPRTSLRKTPEDVSSCSGMIRQVLTEANRPMSIAAIAAALAERGMVQTLDKVRNLIHGMQRRGRLARGEDGPRDPETGWTVARYQVVNR